MGLKINLDRILFVVMLLVCSSSYMYAKMTKNLELTGSMYLNSPFGNYIADVGIIHNWGLGKYISLGAGIKCSYAHVDNLGEWYSGNQRYALDTNKSMTTINGVGAFAVYLPVFKNLGIYGDASLTFDILPWDDIDIWKYRQGKPQDYDTKSISVFNQFSPKAFVGCGLYYDFKQERNTLRVALGYGYGRYDVFHGVRRKTYDGQKLGEHLPNAEYLHRLSLKFVFYY